jgi:four helix bundle protein
MMGILKFEEIQSWKKAKTLTVELYRHFENSKDFGFKDQILRASVSIMNNIAEGFERRSNKEFRYFLYVAKGSCGEVRSMLILAVELSKIDNATAQELQDLTQEISKLLKGLIKTIEA